MYRYVRSSIFLLILLFCSSANGQTGHIRGIVFDSENHNPLAAANVWLDASHFGTTSADDGRFILMNIPAGDYTLHVQYMGYKQLVIKPVTVTPLLTTRVDASLEKTILQGQEVTVVAQDEWLPLTATGDRKVYTESTLKELPFEYLNTLIGAQSGVVESDEALHVRGGRSDELGIYLDGVLLNNPYNRGIDSSILMSGLDQVSYQPGGMDAQIGGFNSGVIFLVSKQGGETLSGQFDLSTDQWLPEREKRFGAYSYGYSQSSAELHGPLPFSKKKIRFFTHLDYLYAKDRSPSYQASVEPSEFVTDIDSLVKLNPLPTALPGPKHGNHRKQWNSLFNLSGNYRGLYLKAGGRFHMKDDRLYQHTRSAFDWQHMPQSIQKDWSLYARLNWLITDKLHVMVDVNTYRFQSIIQDPQIKDDFLNWTNPDMIPNISVWGDFVPGLEEFSEFRGYGSVYGHYLKDESVRNTIKVHSAWQVTSSHRLDIGLERQTHAIRFYNVSYPISTALHRLYETIDSPTDSQIEAVYEQYADYAGFDARGQEYVDTGHFAPRKPVNTSFYIQDTYETSHFVCQLGLRLDQIKIDQKRLVDLYQIPINESGQVDMEQLKTGASYLALSPRIGFAFPVSDRATFHFHYGKYTEAPPYESTYLNWYTLGSDLQSGVSPFLANPSLKPITTTSYEIGCDVGFGSYIRLDATCFYKEIRDQIQMRSIIGAEPMTYTTFVNGDYGTLKGFTWDVYLKQFDHFSGQCSYSLMWSEGTGSNPYSQFAFTLNQDDVYPTLVSPLDYDQRHAFHATVRFQTLEKEGLFWHNRYPFSNLSILFWFTYGSGLPYTRVEEASYVFDVGNVTPVGQLNSQRMPAGSLCHLRVEKRLKKGEWTILPYINILNLFNHKLVRHVYQTTGLPDNDGWLKTPEGQVWQEKNQTAAEWYQAFLADPNNFGMPRQIRLGCKFQF